MRSPLLLVPALFASLSMIACAQPAAEEDVTTSSDSIVGGSEAEVGAWPGTVALYKYGSQSCAGTLVADQWVITAAHCVSKYSETGGVSEVVIGRHRLSAKTVGESRKVDRVFVHEESSGGWGDNDHDIALLHLSEPTNAPKGRLVTSADLDAIVPGLPVTAVGWGNTSEWGSSSDVLRQVTVPVVTNASCAADYVEDDAAVTENMLCAGYPAGKLDACQGDSGGPLFMDVAGTPTLVGIVSWGIGCARPGKPGVYTRVGNYLEWMHEKSNGEIGESATPAPVDPTAPTGSTGTPEEAPATEPTE